MLGGEDALRTLREALRLAPDNVPLRQHLADTLLGLGRSQEAESEYRRALAPNDERLKLGLATAFYRQGKVSPALVIVEDLTKAGDVSPQVRLLYCRLLWQASDVAEAVRQYRLAVSQRPEVADAELPGARR